MSIDLEQVRRDTPGCHELLHFNNAGAALPAQPVTQAVIDHLQLEARMGGYEAATQQQSAVERVYEAAARLLNCGSDEIAVVESATHAWDMAFQSLRLGAGDRVLASVAEYASNYIALLQASRLTGVEIEVIPNDESGQISLEKLQAALDNRVKLISLTHVPTNGGLVNPAREVGQIAQEAGIPFLLDACQSVGQLVVDVQEIGCDFLSVTGRKYLRAPRGTGLLYVRRERLADLEPPFLDLHAASWPTRDRYEVRADARRFENFESNVAAKIGLGVALDYALELGLPAIEARVKSLAAELRRQLADIRGVRVQDRGRELCGIVTFTTDRLTPARLKTALTERSINTWVSGVGNARLDMEERGLDSLLRASVHYYNSEAEVERFCQVVSELLKEQEYTKA